MKIPRRLSSDRAPRPPMTPMIDVVFLLLIYFICTARLTPPEATLPSLTLPAPAESPGSAPSVDEPPRLVVTIPPAPAPVVADGNVCRAPAELAEWLSREAEAGSPRAVVLDVDRQTEMGRAIDVYDQCRLAGLREILFAVRVD